MISARYALKSAAVWSSLVCRLSRLWTLHSQASVLEGLGIVEKPWPCEVNDGIRSQRHKMDKMGNVKEYYIPVLLLRLRLSPRTGLIYGMIYDMIRYDMVYDMMI